MAGGIAEAGTPGLADAAQCFDDKGDPDAVIAACTSEINAGNDLASAHNFRGIAYSGKSNADLAIADFDRAIEIDPGYASAFSNRGAAYYLKGDMARALADETEAIRLEPDAPTPYFNRGLALDRKGMRAEAVEDFTKAIALKPDYANPYGYRGADLAARGDYAKSIKDLDMAIHLDPGFARAYNEKAWLLATCADAKFRNGARALELALKAVEIADSWRYRDTLAAAYAEAGKFADASREERKALEMLGLGTLPDVSAEMQKRLVLFQNSQPYHKMPAKPQG